MHDAILYHNPRCSKSREALAYLQSTKLDFEVVEYLKHPLNYTQVENLFAALPTTNALDIVRKKEAEFKQAGLSKESDNNEVLRAIHEYPKLLERPILLRGNIAAIGRPLENIKELVSE